MDAILHRSVRPVYSQSGSFVFPSKTIQPIYFNTRLLHTHSLTWTNIGNTRIPSLLALPMDAACGYTSLDKDFRRNPPPKLTTYQPHHRMHVEALTHFNQPGIRCSFAGVLEGSWTRCERATILIQRRWRCTKATQEVALNKADHKWTQQKTTVEKNKTSKMDRVE